MLFVVITNQMMEITLMMTSDIKNSAEYNFAIMISTAKLLTSM